MLMAFAACAFAQSSRPPETQQDDAAAKRQQEAINQLNAIRGELASIRAQQAATEQRAAEHEAANDNYLSPANASQWVLAFFAAVAAVIAACSLSAIQQQAIHTETAANAAMKAANVAELELKLVHQQWLDVVPVLPIIATELPNRIILSPMFRIQNNTPMALTLKKTEAIVDGLPPGEWTINEPDQVLLKGKDYPGFTGFAYLDTADQWAAYIAGSLSVNIYGRLHFVDAFGDTRFQPFGIAYRGGKNGWGFTDYSGAMAETELPPPSKANAERQS